MTAATNNRGDKEFTDSIVNKINNRVMAFRREIQFLKNINANLANKNMHLKNENKKLIEVMVAKK